MLFIVRVSPDGNPDPRTEFPDQLRQELRITGVDALKIDGINRSAPSRSDGQPDRPPSSSLFCQGGSSGASVIPLEMVIRRLNLPPPPNAGEPLRGMSHAERSHTARVSAGGGRSNGCGTIDQLPDDDLFHVVHPAALANHRRRNADTPPHQPPIVRRV